jgi:hypothetical protein
VYSDGSSTTASSAVTSSSSSSSSSSSCINSSSSSGNSQPVVCGARFSFFVRQAPAAAVSAAAATVGDSSGTSVSGAQLLSPETALQHKQRLFSASPPPEHAQQLNVLLVDDMKTNLKVRGVSNSLPMWHCCCCTSGIQSVLTWYMQHSEQYCSATRAVRRSLLRSHCYIA